jgi:hypothetical protein
MFHKLFPLLDWFRRLTTPEIADIVNSAMYPGMIVHIETSNLEKELPNFEKLRKKELVIWAKDHLGLNIDITRTKIYMIEQINDNINKKES